MSDSGYPIQVLDSAAPHQVHIIFPPRRRYWLHLLLFLATAFSTLIVGARLQYNYLNVAPQFTTDDDLLPVMWTLQQPSRLLLGIPFSATLLCILLAHEMGHFVYARRHGVYATLPFFLPAPTVIGTFGAFIRIRSPIPDRTALMDIGIAGPIAGFVVAIPILVASLILSPTLGHSSGSPLGMPLVFDGLWRALHPFSHIPLSDANLHPSAIAAWVGMLATALNLLPAGQLDGGHIVYSIFPRLHRTATRLTALALFPMGLFLWGGWLLWGAVLMLPWMHHPPVPEYPRIDRKRRLLGAAALLMFVVSFPLVPFAGHSPWEQLRPWIVAHLHW
ncbi:MAG TPA: site-2 protease family protein [Terriglobales bacterium]|nr:site-2 protease family protein [Terriglobales bacterium]